MVDKLGIDSSIRLSGNYHRVKKYNPFPILANAPGYELYNQNDFSDTSTKIYNAGVSCRGNEEPGDSSNEFAPLKQLKHIWEQAILMGIGSKRDVNAERVFFYFDNTVCVYPAQSFDDFKWSGNS